MATIELTQANFEDTIENNDIVLIDFWAEWCGPCRQFAPVFEAVSNKHDDVVFGKVDTDAQQQLAAMFQIRSIPTLVVFRSQIPVFSQPGALPAPMLEQLVDKVRELDMDKVREEYEKAVAEAEAQGGGGQA